MRSPSVLRGGSLSIRSMALARGVLPGGDALGDGPQLREGELGASRDPAGQGCGGPFGGVGGGAGEIEQLPDLLQGGPGKADLAGEGGDPLIAGGHGGQLSRGGSRDRETR